MSLISMVISYMTAVGLHFWLGGTLIAFHKVVHTSVACLVQYMTKQKKSFLSK
jgi:hypothetical protein